LRSLFAATTACALCALVYRLTGGFETVVVAFAIVVCAVCVGKWKYRLYWLRGILMAACAAAVWMVGVDYSEFREGCEHCGSHWSVGEARVFHQAIWTRKSPDHFPIWKMIAEDLGAPCPHHYERWHKIRLWGLIWPGPPWQNGTCCLSSKDSQTWYEEVGRTRVKALAASDPEVAAEFRQRALQEQDLTYLRSFLTRIHSLKEF